MIDSFIENTNRANNKEDVYQIFQSALESMGYDRLIYCYATDQPKLNRKAEFGIVTTYPEEWTNYYNQSNFMDHDPVVRQLFKSDGPFAWESIIEKQELTKIQSKIMHEAEDVGIFSGVGVGVHEGMEVSGFGITSSFKQAAPNKDMLAKLNLLAFQFHEVYSKLNYAQPTASPNNLSLREIEILHWMSEGKSDQSIADILFIQHATVRYHINNIFLKIGANNRTMAVVKAIKMQLITPSFIGTLFHDQK